MEVPMAMASPSPPRPSCAPFPFDLDEDDDGNDLASLMPNCFPKLTVDDDAKLDFHDVHRFLSLETSNEFSIQGNSYENQCLGTTDKRKEQNVQKGRLEAADRLDTSSRLTRSEYPDGKENAISGKLPRRQRFLRREGSKRITSHRPFKVDLRPFASILNKGASEDLQIPRDVHAFWEREEEREALEVIMRKVRGERDLQSDENTRTRRPCARRAGSQRRRRSRCITLDLTSYAKQVQSLDEELLEEEEDTNVKSFTFVKTPGISKEKRPPSPIQESQSVHSYSMYSYSVRSENLSRDETSKAANYVDNTSDMVIVLSEDESPFSSTKDNGQCICNKTDLISGKGGSIEDLEGLPTILLQESDNAQVPVQEAFFEPVNSSAADKKARHSQEEAKVNLEDVKVIAHDKGGAIKRTPYTSPTPPSHPLAAIGFIRENAKRIPHTSPTPPSNPLAAIGFTIENAKRTPYTSPTPPSNPLAAFGFIRESAKEGSGKRKIDFDNAMDSSLFEPASPASTERDQHCLQKSSASPVSPIKTVQGETPPLRDDTNSVSANEVSKITADKVNQNKQPRKVQNEHNAKREKAMNRRNSLAVSGTAWENGARRSTRIRSRPLEWWRGERFLYGRVHRSLATVIGIKYSSPPPCRPKRGAPACPRFKVESFVSEKYADYVRYAAL